MRDLRYLPLLGKLLFPFNNSRQLGHLVFELIEIDVGDKIARESVQGTNFWQGMQIDIDNNQLHSISKRFINIPVNVLLSDEQSQVN